MRRARISDHWDTVSDIRRYPCCISKIRQYNSTAETIFEPDGLTAIVGGNGAGKTSFFEYLLNKGYQKRTFNEHIVEMGDGVSINVFDNDLDAVLIHPSKDIAISNGKLKLYESTIGQGELSPIDKEYVSLISYVLGIEYSKILIESVEVGDEEYSPRFEVYCNERTISHEELSFGEQVVIYLYWYLTKKYTEPKIFFIEEPESGLSPRTQSRLIDLFAVISSDRKKQVFFSTHSPYLVNALGEDRVIVLKNDNVITWSSSNDNSYIRELGLSPVKKNIFLLEDNKAKVFFEKILDVYGSYISKSSHIVHLGGESDVFEVVNRLSGRFLDLNIIGIIDADQKSDSRFHSDKFYFLPGTLAPEQEVIASIKENLDEYARCMKIAPGKIRDAFDNCKTSDHHDFFEEFSKHLFDEVKVHVYSDAFNIWFDKYQDLSEIAFLVRNLDESISEDDIRDIHDFFRPEQV